MTVWLLVLWFGSTNGGPAIVDGFTSKAACETAYSEVKYATPGLWINPSHFCVEIRK